MHKKIIKLSTILCVITNKLQKANCDAFGIDKHLIACHPDLWKKKIGIRIM